MTKYKIQVNTQEQWQEEPQYEDVPNATFETLEEAEAAPEKLVRVCGYPKNSDFRIVEDE